MNRPVFSILLSFLLIFHSSTLFSLEPVEELQNYIAKIKEFSLNEDSISKFVDLLKETQRSLDNLSYEGPQQLSPDKLNIQLKKLIEIAETKPVKIVREGQKEFIKSNGGSEPGLWEQILSFLKNPYVQMGIGVLSAITLWWAFGDQFKSFLGLGTNNYSDNENTKEDEPIIINWSKDVILTALKKEDMTTILHGRDNDGNTALIWSAGNKHTEIVNELLKVIDTDYIKIQNKNKRTALISAIIYGNSETVKTLLKHMEHNNIGMEKEQGRTALMWATFFGEEINIKVLTEFMKKVGLNPKDLGGSTVTQVE